MATDLATALALGQVGQAGQTARTQRALAERLIGGATAGRPVYSPWAALAQGLTGGIGGYMAADADARQQEAQQRAIADALAGQRTQQANQREEVATITQGRTLPEGVEGPVLPALTGAARMDALAALVPNNPAAAAQLGVDTAREQREFQERMQRDQRATQLTVAGIAAGTRNQETFGEPQTVLGPDGQPRLVRFGNRGTAQPVEGYGPSRTATTGFTPIWTQDANGNFIPALPTNDGRVVPVPQPPGTTFLPPTRDQNLGGTIQPVATAGAVPMGAPRPVDSETPATGTARGREIGQQQGSQIANAPDVMRTSETLLGQIDAVLNHRAFGAGTGLTGRVFNNIPGTPTFDFGQRVEQLQGQAFLQAFDGLRGGGAITEREGTLATQAIARLNAAVTPSDFRQALGELRSIVEGARNRAAARVPQQPAQAIPGPGGVGTAEPPPANRPPLSAFERR